MKVYVVSSGCKYEGGGVRGVYADPEVAKAFAREKANEDLASLIRAYEPQPEDELCSDVEEDWKKKREGFAVVETPPQHPYILDLEVESDYWIVVEYEV